MGSFNLSPWNPVKEHNQRQCLFGMYDVGCLLYLDWYVGRRLFGMLFALFGM